MSNSNGSSSGACSDNGEYVEDGSYIDPSITPATKYDTVYAHCIDGHIPDEVGCRTDLLDTRQKLAVETQIANCGPLLFMPHTTEESTDASGNYVMNLYGVLTDGSKTHVKINGAKPFFDVKIDNMTNAKAGGFANLRKDESTSAAELASMCGLKAAVGNCVFGIENLFPLHGLADEPSTYIRVHSKNGFARKTAIEKARSAGFQTANDDRPSAHHRKFARDLNIPLCDWLSLSNYRTTTGNGALDKAAHTILIDHSIQNIRAVVDPIDPTPQSEEFVSSREYLLNEPLLVGVWDIETCSSREGNPLPEAHYHETDEVFMIFLSLFWRGAEQPIRNFCLVTTECEKPPPHNWDVFMFSNEKDMIIGFAELLGRFNPDIIAGFNDTVYDWPFIITKARSYNIVVELLDGVSISGRRRGQTDAAYMKYSIRDRQEMKIAASMNQYATYPHVPGVVCLDLRIAYMKIHPRSEKTSLKFFLETEGLDTKADMPYLKMFKIYRERDPVGMSRVAHYCGVDAVRCQALINARSVIGGVRQVAVLSYCNIHDAIFYANGAKVVNMTAAYAKLRNIVISFPWDSYDNEDVLEDDVQFEGGYVFEPKKGPVARPITGLDFASLYPSLMMTYNLSPEKITTDKKQVDEMTAKGVNFYKIEGDIGATHIEAWTKRHDNVETDIGLFPSILIKLKLSRSTIKKEMAALKMRIKHKDYKSESERIQLECRANVYDSKQAAAKVFMNTFYGVTGFKKSPLYRLEIAYGTTRAGQQNIHKVAQFVKDAGFEIIYGDTDSVYVSCNEKDFVHMDKTYSMSKKDTDSRILYWKQQVWHSIRANKILEPAINEMLLKDNGSKYLRMVREGTKFPAAMLGKKKYCGLEHEDEDNIVFDQIEKNLAVKGIEVVKQGKSKLLRKIGFEIMHKFVDCRLSDEERDLQQLTFNVIKRVITEKDWEFSDFIKSFPYKRSTKNATVAKFVAKMEERGGRIPEYGERFQCIVTSRPPEYDIRGKLIKFAMGDCLEYADYAKENGIEPDIKYYLINNVIGLCARFISYAADYNKTNNDTLPYKVRDHSAFLAAKKDLRTYIDTTSRSTTLEGISKADQDTLGKKCKRAYITGQDIAHKLLVKHESAKVADVIHGQWQISEEALAAKEDNGIRSAVKIFVENMSNNAKKDAEYIAARPVMYKRSNDLARALGIDEHGYNVSDANTTTSLINTYKATRINTANSVETLYKKQMRMVATDLMDLRRDLIKIVPTYLSLLEAYNEHITHVVVAARDEKTAEVFNMSDEFRDAAVSMHRIWDSMVALEVVRIEYVSFSNLIEALYNKRFPKTSGDVRDSCRF